MFWTDRSHEFLRVEAEGAWTSEQFWELAGASITRTCQKISPAVAGILARLEDYRLPFGADNKGIAPLFVSQVCRAGGWHSVCVSRV